MNPAATQALHGGAQTVLVTGANGFVGRALCRELVAAGYVVHAALRSFQPPEILSDGIKQFLVGDFGPAIEWGTPLGGVDTVIHLLSGLASDTLPNASELDKFRLVNVEGTRSLAVAAIRHGVRRFISMSTIKVLGEQSDSHAGFTEDSPPHPEDAYAQSKWEAEQVLTQLCASVDMALTVLRPPLVYGPFCKGNFTALLRAVDRNLPLPLASIQNRRSLIYVGNLISAVQTCLTTSKVSGNTYVVSDGAPVSTPELIARIATALGKHPRLFPFPPGLLDLGARLVGKKEAARRLTGSLCVDDSKIRNDLGWNPPFTLAQGLASTAQWYHSQIHIKSDT